MNKCSKVKNPCKLCFRSVTTKTGVQCKGVCKKWAHFKCLNYTPGKIQDIKAGLIRITCPCPDCNSSEPKEIVLDSPYACTNFQCPANSLPICESTECPSMYHLTNQTLLPKPSASSITANMRSRCSVKRFDRAATPPVLMNWPPESSSFPNSLSTSCRKKCDSSTYKSYFPAPNRCQQSNCSHSHCSKVKNKMCSPIRSLSCSFVDESVCNDSGATWIQKDTKRSIARDAETSPKYISSSDSQLSKARDTQKSLYCTMEQMCTTVGQLSGQLKELMCRMMEAFEKTTVHSKYDTAI
ncbi:PREDICTED: uncharacterized protein LOC106106140 [Papilio polytes]|uniref:uncharacterized protein LOC106106140 n=1 Tax=Papilio polytes TaxID=76194 RepID=UPI0006761155|nr:PREDICTED: uncharacterized protein LOC106106140 [Papilio polytes]